ncbi:uncharacterized protein LOC122302545 isoform X2 [Carya illinoinensis]|uniref:uncharacterized protein LOC122302545 isoform X2 n=1 Tax=Carya illinoinensis TaxID=32201 RepID=UPI001C720C83|nr:uncharacterized protein LOC122302545 isoform X2 [Carya illinoinensis]
MEEEKDAFYVVRKGDIVGIYKTLSDCQAQAGSSACNPSVSVYKGYCLPKEAEEYLASHGLKNATYSTSVVGVKEDLFGKLVACPYQEMVGSASFSSNPQKKPFRLDYFHETQAISLSCRSCILQFDGASKGNPGQAGAGAVLRAEDGSMVCRLSEGVGIATNNVAEYRAVILGLKHALKKGYKYIRVQGDSKLVCMQIQGLWKTKNQNMADLCKEAKELKDKFLSFQINHIVRELNSEADTQANLAVDLMDGQIVEDCRKK